MLKKGVLWGCGYGAASILLGAFISHGLKGAVSKKDLEILEISSRYLMYVAIPLLVLSLTHAQWQWPNVLFNMFILSGVLFSGSLIAYVAIPWPWLVFVTPIGGGLMVLSWAYLGYVAIRKINW